MLDQMRQRGASIFIYLIFGLLIVLFVINIAPTGNQGDGGCRGTRHDIVDVDGARASENAYKVAYSSPWNQYPGREKVYYALDTLVRRELLASAAEERGLRVTQEVLDEEIKQGFFFTGGERKPLGQMIFDDRQTWNLRKFRGFVQSLDVSKNAYNEDQKRNLQATLMAELLASSAQVARDEALKSYQFDHDTVTYDVLAFAPATYATAMLLTDADAERFLAAHEDLVKARHKEKEREFIDRKPELKLRQIFIAKAEPQAKPDEAKPDDKKVDDKKADDKKADDKKADDKKPAEAKADDKKAADAKKPDDKKAVDAKKPDDKKAADAKKPDDKKAGKAGDAAKPAGMSIAEAKARLEAVRDAVTAGKQKFADAARDLNTEPTLKANGGSVGWKSIDSPGVGEKVVSDAVKALKPGEMTPVITTDRGVYLVIAEDRREKTLTYEQVKLELAAELAREVWGKEGAKRAALKALEDARASKKNLDDIYLRELKPGMNLEELQRQMDDPNVDPQIRQIIEQQMRRQIEQLGGGQEQGSIVIESPNIYAASKAGDESPAGGSAAPAAPAPAGSAAPAAGGTAPAAGGTAPAAPAAPIVASSDTLPAFADLPKPKIRRESNQKRLKKLPGVGTDVKLLFDELGKGEYASRVLEVEGSYTVVQVVDKTQGTVDDFDKDAVRIMDEMRKTRGEQLVHDWVKSRCEELTAAGKIKPRADKTAETDDKGKPMPIRYRPCMMLR